MEEKTRRNSRVTKQEIKSEAHEHSHSHDDGHEHCHHHEDGESHHHGHSHSHKQTKVVLNRMARAIGHMESVKRMVEQGRECNEVLIQLSAVSAALSKISKIILQDHIDNCIVEAVKNNDQETIDKLKDAINKMIK